MAALGHTQGGGFNTSYGPDVAETCPRATVVGNLVFCDLSPRRSMRPDGSMKLA